jgi:hypothetical protein
MPICVVLDIIHLVSMLLHDKVGNMIGVLDMMKVINMRGQGGHDRGKEKRDRGGEHDRDGGKRDRGKRT